MALPNELQLVRRVKADLVARGVTLDGPCGAFAVTHRVAWALRTRGAGLLGKPAGNQCRGYAVDIVVFPEGTCVDVLIDSGAANIPAWNVQPDRVEATRWYPPIDPGDDPVPERPTPLPPAPPPLPVDPPLWFEELVAAVESIYEAMGAIVEASRALEAEIAKVRAEGVRLKWR